MKAWEQFKDLQAKEMGQEIVDRWLSAFQVTHFDACNLYLEANSLFQINWFEEHIRSKVETKFVNENNKSIKVHLSLPYAKASEPKKQKTLLQEFSLSFDPVGANFSLSSYRFTEENALIEKMFLEITSCGTLGKQAPSLPQKERFPFNPLYLYGPKGTGKTHLLQAAAKSLQEQGVGVLYVTAKTFTEHVVSAIRASEMGLFREAYRTIDVLFIDNVEELSRKTATQEELFHTFNALHLQGKLIVFASNTLPHHLQNIEARLVSRFEWGVVLVLKPLPKKLIEELLEEHAKTLQFPLRPQIKEFLLTHFTSHSTVCLQALQLLAVRIQSRPTPISSTQLSLESAKLLLKDLLEQQEKDRTFPLEKESV